MLKRFKVDLSTSYLLIVTFFFPCFFSQLLKVWRDDGQIVSYQQLSSAGTLHSSGGRLCTSAAWSGFAASWEEKTGR